MDRWTAPSIFIHRIPHVSHLKICPSVSSMCQWVNEKVSGRKKKPLFEHLKMNGRPEIVVERDKLRDISRLGVKTTDRLMVIHPVCGSRQEITLCQIYKCFGFVKLVASRQLPSLSLSLTSHYLFLLSVSTLCLFVYVFCYRTTGHQSLLKSLNGQLVKWEALVFC